MRRMMWILLSLPLFSVAAQGQSTRPPTPQEKQPHDCDTVIEYKEKAPPGYIDVQAATIVWWDLMRCEKWAEDNGHQAMTRDAFHALDSLYARILDEWVKGTRSGFSVDDAPAACRPYHDFLKASHDAVVAKLRAHESADEAAKASERAEQDYKARIVNGSSEDLAAIDENLSGCFSWAFKNHREVLARDIWRLQSDLLILVSEGQRKELIKAYNELLARYDELFALAKRQAVALSLSSQPVTVNPSFQPPPRLHCREQTQELGYSWVTTIDCR